MTGGRPERRTIRGEDEAGVPTTASYAEWMAPRRLVAHEPRRVEPTYPRHDVGTYMAFR